MSSKTPPSQSSSLGSPIVLRAEEQKEGLGMAPSILHFQPFQEATNL